ncbi:MAG: O-antigen ligase family protein [Erysipelotrichaceae bacterium]|nr:O-antigen ligase family protein [Erysipelotrichaceae bacterium]
MAGNKTRKIYEVFSDLLYYAFFFFAVILMVLYFHDAYFDIMEAKAGLFFKACDLLLPFMVILTIAKCISRQLFRKSIILDLPVVLFLISASVSTFNSYSINNAYTGDQGWYVGYKVILFLVMSFLALKDRNRDNRIILFFLYLVFVFECGISILTVFDIDLLKMREGLSLSSFYSYYGTIGNSNWFAGYLSLLVPFILCKYFLSENRIEAIAFCVLSFLGILVSVIIGVDSIYLACAFCIPLILPTILAELSNIRKLSGLLSILFLTMFIFQKSGAAFSYFALLDGISLFLFRYSLILFFINSIVFISSCFIKKESYQNIRKRIIVIAEVVYLISLIMAAIILSRHVEADWGSHRIELWSLSLKAFKNFTPFMKIFGIGPEMLRNIYAPMSSKYGIVYNVSHSEPIQVLLTMGISGLLTWLFSWASVLMGFIKEIKSHDQQKICLYAGLFAYFGQALVNSATLTNIVLLLCFAIFISQAENQNF